MSAQHGALCVVEAEVGGVQYRAGGVVVALPDGREAQPHPGGEDGGAASGDTGLQLGGRVQT